ncbi:hypothetical protein [uncultured Roseobacter sp.]|uniref:hypothetical protein n=1 Tax=uncultured Roseobacter sp. TaxID=114847 RepID=UPI00261AE217|nr:hypothetical protein [uncultured Roseobacter sp.]
MQSAKAIYQSVLERLAKAVFDNDYRLWSTIIGIPFQMTTAEGTLVHENERDVAVGFADFVGALRRKGVVRMVQVCRFAYQSERDTITGYHDTVMYTADGTALPEYTVKWVLHLQDSGTWHVSKDVSTISAEDRQLLPHSDFTQFQREDTSEEMRLRRVVQTMLDKADTTLLHGDFDEWKGSYLLPLVVETRQGQSIIEDMQTLREDFDIYRNEFRIHGVTDITRVIRTAEKLDDDLMLATYRAHVISGARYVVPPWTGAMTFRRQDGFWYITKIMQALGHLNWISRDTDAADQSGSLPSAKIIDIAKDSPKKGKK